MKSLSIFIGLVTSLLTIHTNATVVNISTQLGQNSVEVQVGAIRHVGLTLQLDPGTYTVSPVDTSFGGALYTSANRFSSVSLPYKGWEWNVFLSFDGGLTGEKHGFGGGSPSGDGSYQATADLAFSAAPRPFTIELLSPTAVTFYWLDDNFSDNSGGISLYIPSVPEPNSGLLLLSGLVALVGARRAYVRDQLLTTAP